MEDLDERRERLFTKLTEAGGRLRIRNALNPILWLTGVVAPACLAVIGFAKDPPIIVSIVLCCVVGTALLAFLYLLVRDPDRLQSEEYLLRRRTLEIIEEKGSKKAIDTAIVAKISESDFLDLS